MKETILIIMFLSIILIFIFIHSSEVSFQESFVDNDHYLVRNLDDKDKAADLLAEMKKRLYKLVLYSCEKNDENDEDCIFIKKYSETIKRKFKKIIFRESTENNKFTSYSVNKGEEIVFCLRCKEDNSLHNVNELMYVAIHEIAHVGCPEIGHTPLFLKINKILLKNATECNVYVYKNYSLFPEKYCGIKLSTNILN
jgi:hypothetical protein